MSKNEKMTVKEITKEWLKANGYDGLANPKGCGCLIDDLIPCLSLYPKSANTFLTSFITANSPSSLKHCEAGHKVEYEGGICPDDKCLCTKDTPWHIYPGKKDKENSDEQG